MAMEGIVKEEVLQAVDSDIYFLISYTLRMRMVLVEVVVVVAVLIMLVVQNVGDVFYIGYIRHAHDDVHALRGDAC